MCISGLDIPPHSHAFHMSQGKGRTRQGTFILGSSEEKEGCALGLKYESGSTDKQCTQENTGLILNPHFCP